MASISTDRNGLRRILFIDGNGDRKTIRFGRTPKKDLNGIKLRVEALVAANAGNYSLERETAEWVAGIEDRLHAKLAAVGLVSKRVAPDATAVGAFTLDYIERRTDTKSSTRVSMKLARNRLIAYFDAGRDIRSITPLDADMWAVWLKEQKYADATIARTIKRARQFFRAAKRGDLIGRNPFEELKIPNTANPDRLFFVTREMTDSVLAQCPTNEWKLIFALCRYGGLRCPSELLSLTWADVDRERERILVYSTKLEHHATKRKRFIPLFPELKPLIQQAYDECPDGEKYVIRKTRDTNANLRTRLTRYIERAGLKPWPRLFQNLRASRETELAGQFPLHVVTEWLGNSNLIAAKHYLSVTDADFDKAVKGGAKSDARTAQNPAQPGSVNECREMPIPSEVLARQASGHALAHKVIASNSSGDGPGGTRTHTPFGTGS